MGKPTGFLEYTRREDGRRPAAERVRDWEEFHLPLPEEIRRQQGALRRPLLPGGDDI